MKVAITGGNGHIGNAIIEELLRRDYTIKALVHSKSNFLESRAVEIVKGSLLDENSLTELMKDCDYLIHCAAIISISGDQNGLVQEINIKGLENVLRVALKSNLKRVIHLSSVHAYNHQPMNELLNEKRNFVSDTAYHYDKSKRDGQLLAHKYFEAGLPIIVVNPTSVFGPPNYAKCKQNSAFISMSKGKVPFVFKGGYNWVDVRDIANSICNALTQGQIGESYILGGNYYTLKDLSRVVAKVSNKRIPCFEVPIGLVKSFLPIIGRYYKIRKQDPSLTKESIEILEFGNKQINSEKARKDLGHNPRPIEDTMKDLLTWHSENQKS
ncbi:NAD-dependent epimerase/dehydratase family protein [Fluviicola taffensis]|uniref:NAD-dependent epimerase/dehydratase n=1 Tax=Fluviicola taffensis (strain DSM 16823 / NCIMB 13979 / RW262) TaxID=755732 RepID=F2ICP2_FLUTR|nr:NAD-dependent epimerase/dehydratase family protein [Fluviicola taffensis]AEA42269.1 NAD-dependent epimerase/dehydratase [Fluviicola taffensis DSM 16823]